MQKAVTTLGIDEAGRGPALGPMVLASVAVDSAGEAALIAAGLADSKSYGSSAKAKRLRGELAETVKELALFSCIEVVEAPRLDDRVFVGELNQLEREIAEKMISKAPSCQRIVCDGERLFRPLCQRHPQLEAVNKAESVHVSVAAASVLAKHTRDTLYGEMVSRYAREYGPITGGGYVNAGTRRFLCEYAKRNHRLPPEARRSWPYTYLAEWLSLDAKGYLLR